MQLIVERFSKKDSDHKKEDKAKTSSDKDNPKKKGKLMFGFEPTANIPKINNFPPKIDLPLSQGNEEQEILLSPKVNEEIKLEAKKEKERSLPIRSVNEDLKDESLIKQKPKKLFKQRKEKPVESKQLKTKDDIEYMQDIEEQKAPNKTKKEKKPQSEKTKTRKLAAANYIKLDLRKSYHAKGNFKCRKPNKKKFFNKHNKQLNKQPTIKYEGLGSYGLDGPLIDNRAKDSLIIFSEGYKENTVANHVGNIKYYSNRIKGY